jgi:hypothetical protein
MTIFCLKLSYDIKPKKKKKSNEIYSILIGNMSHFKYVAFFTLFDEKNDLNSHNLIIYTFFEIVGILLRNQFLNLTNSKLGLN